MDKDNQLPYSVKCEVTLSNPDGKPVPDGIYDITFQLFESSSAKEARWTEKQSSVLVRQGKLVTLLGQGALLSADLLKLAPFLETQVGDVTSLARQQIDPPQAQASWQLAATASFTLRSRVESLQAWQKPAPVADVPTRVFRLPINPGPLDMVVSNSHAYIAGYYYDDSIGVYTNYLQIVDISDPAHPGEPILCPHRKSRRCMGLWCSSVE
jgi:hypothetical protein